jgi:transposase-like protein
MKPKVSRFPDELQLQIVQEYLYTEISQLELKKKYNFGGSQTIYKWMSKFGLSKEDNARIESRQTMAKQIEKTSLELELELKIKKLEEDLKYEQLRTKALSLMIDIAERELKVDIRKKSGAKR